MRKYKVPLIALVVGLFMGVAAMYVIGQKTGVTVEKEVPSEAEQKYTQLTEQYKGTLGTTLSRCMAAQETVYTVAGSSGYVGETFYYNQAGSELGRTEFYDTDVESDEPPVKIDQNSCEIIRSTVPEIQ